MSHVQPATLEITHPAYDQLKKNGGILSEITVNGDKFVPEAVLFAAMDEVDRLRGIRKWKQDEIDRLRTALQLIADGRCKCGGQFKEDSNYQVRCENCDAHRGYGYGNARMIAEEALKPNIGRLEVWEEERRGAGY